MPIFLHFLGDAWCGLFQKVPCPHPLKCSSLLGGQLGRASSRENYFPHRQLRYHQHFMQKMSTFAESNEHVLEWNFQEKKKRGEKILKLCFKGKTLPKSNKHLLEWDFWGKNKNTKCPIDALCSLPSVLTLRCKNRRKPSQDKKKAKVNQIN